MDRWRAATSAAVADASGDDAPAAVARGSWFAWNPSFDQEEALEVPHVGRCRASFGEAYEMTCVGGFGI